MGVSIFAFRKETSIARVALDTILPATEDRVFQVSELASMEYTRHIPCMVRDNKTCFKASLNFPNAHIFIITKMIVINDVCSIAKIIPIDPLVTVF